MRHGLLLAVTLLLACPSKTIDSDGGEPPDGGEVVPPDGGGGCVEDAPCVPDNPCHAGAMSCFLIAICVDTGASLPNGASCGPTFTCNGGMCSGYLVLTKTGGDDQHVLPFQRVPEAFEVKLADQLGNPIAGQRIDFQALEASPPFAVTDAAGKASTRVRAGLRGSVVATGPMNTKVTFNLSIDEPDAGVVYDWLGEDRDAGHDGDGRLGPEGHVGAIRALAAFGGTLYFTDDCTVRAISGDGVLSTVAGDGTCGFAGDGADAKLARFDHPGGLFVDVYENLYVADTNNDRIRKIDKATHQVSTYAGGGSAGWPTFGDGPDARLASLSRPTALVHGKSATSIYIADVGHDLIREVYESGGVGQPPVMETVLAPDAGACSDRATFLGCGGPTGCSMASTLNEVYVAGAVCGTDFGGPTSGVIRLDYPFDSWAAGSATGTPLAVEGRAIRFGEPPLLTADLGGGHIAVADPGAHRVWAAEESTGLLPRILGDGTAGTTGNYVLGTAARVARPTALMVSSGHVWVADSDAHALRVVWNAAPAARGVAFTYVGGAGETVYAMQATAQPFEVKLSAGPAPVEGVSIDWVGTSRCRTAPAVSVTAANGIATAGARVGWRDCESFATLRSWTDPPSLGGFTKKTMAMPAGWIVTAVNETGSAGPGPLPDLGVTAALPAPKAVSGGYFVSGCAVLEQRWDGWVGVVAGRVADCGFSGDGAQAKDALLSNPGDVSYNSTYNALYIADTGNDRIRLVNLYTGVIDTVAGGGTGTPAADGDGLPAKQAILSRPEHVAADAFSVYIADNGHNRVRMVDSGGVMRALLAPTACNGKSIAFAGCTTPRACSMVRGGGGIYLAATICGSGPGGTTSGIVAAGPGFLNHVVGRVGGSTADGTAGTQLAVSGELAVGAQTDLYFAETANHRVRKLTGFVNPVVSTVAGTGARGFTGDYGPATAATLAAPEGLDVGSGSVTIADTGNNALRVVGF